MPVNIQINDGNFSFGPQTGFFYTLSNSLKSLLQVEADGTVVAAFPVTGALLRTSVRQLHFDGTFFWTLEDLPSDLGLVIRKWRLIPFKTFAFPAVTPTEFRWQDELSLIHAPNIRWEAQGFAVEHYHRTFDGSFLRGANTIRLNSVDNISPGDVLYLGPSGFGGFAGNEERIIVSSVNSTLKQVNFTKSGGLENSYLSDDPLDFSKSVFLFNDHSFSGLEDSRGTLVRFAWPRKSIILSDLSFRYFGVNAADFDNTTLSWIRSTQIFEVDLSNPTFSVLRSIEANLLEADMNTVIPVSDLIADLDSNLYYKLQQKETTESIGTGLFSTVDFTPDFNFQTQTTLPVVNSISLSFPEGRFTLPFSSGETLQVTAQIRDQFNFPVLGESIQFSASLNPLSPAGAVGTFSPPVDVTNASGIAQTTYTPSNSTENLLVDIQGQVL